jgi:hypothetical protein
MMTKLYPKGEVFYRAFNINEKLDTTVTSIAENYVTDEIRAKV